MMSKNKVPQVRFKGFSEEWNSLGFDETFSNISNNNLSRAELNYEFGRGRNVHYGDILIRFSEILDVEKAIIPYITNDEYVNKFKNSKLQNGDIIIADAAEDETVGKCTEVVNIKDKIVFSGLHTIAVRPTKEFAPKYLGYYMNSSSYHNQLLPLLQGTKVLSISKLAIKNTDIDFPKDKNEQTKIGDYFQQLDKLIKQKEKKYQKLKQFKKAMLDKMFPKNGADTPEIRFKGFRGKWEEKRLEEIALIKTGYPFDSNKFDANGEYLVITNGNIQNDFSFVDNLLGNKINIEDKCSLTEYILNLNDILVTMDGTVGRVAKVIHEKQILAQRVGRIISLINSDFVYYFLSTGDFFKKMKLISTGGTIKHISLNDISKYESYIPKDFEEQKKIGDYFQKLDNQIELQQKELEKLKNIKKASLAKMFV